jgi:hypothetical protein
MSTVTLYTLRCRRKPLRKWADRLPREIGAAIVSDAIRDLLAGDASGVKDLDFVRHVDGRRRHKRHGMP